MFAEAEAYIADLVRDNPVAISVYLTEKFAENDPAKARIALSTVMKAQNVKVLARDAGLRRDTLYRTFGGRTDPQLGRTLKLFAAMNVQACVSPLSGIDRPDAVATLLNKTLVCENPAEVIRGLATVVKSQNVTKLASALGIMRTTVYKTFGGAVDPHLSSVLNLFAALRVRMAIVPVTEPKARPPRPKLGRPPKAKDL